MDLPYRNYFERGLTNQGPDSPGPCVGGGSESSRTDSFLWHCTPSNGKEQFWELQRVQVLHVLPVHSWRSITLEEEYHLLKWMGQFISQSYDFRLSAISVKRLYICYTWLTIWGGDCCFISFFFFVTVTAKVLKKEKGEGGKRGESWNSGEELRSVCTPNPTSHLCTTLSLLRDATHILGNMNIQYRPIYTRIHLTCGSAMPPSVTCLTRETR